MAVDVEYFDGSHDTVFDDFSESVDVVVTTTDNITI